MRDPASSTCTDSICMAYASKYLVCCIHGSCNHVVELEMELERADDLFVRTLRCVCRLRMRVQSCYELLQRVNGVLPPAGVIAGVI